MPSTATTGRDIVDLYDVDTRLEYPVLRVFDLSALATVGIEPNAVPVGRQYRRFYAYYRESVMRNRAGNPCRDVVHLEPIDTPATAAAVDPSRVLSASRVAELRAIKGLLATIAEHLHLDPAATRPEPVGAQHAAPSAAPNTAPNPVASTAKQAGRTYRDGSHPAAGNPYRDVVHLEPIDTPATAAAVDPSELLAELCAIRCLLATIAEHLHLDPAATRPEPVGAQHAAPSAAPSAAPNPVASTAKQAGRTYRDGSHPAAGNDAERAAFDLFLATNKRPPANVKALRRLITGNYPPRAVELCPRLPLTTKGPDPRLPGQVPFFCGRCPTGQPRSPFPR